MDVEICRFKGFTTRPPNVPQTPVFCERCCAHDLREDSADGILRILCLARIVCAIPRREQPGCASAEGPTTQL